MSEQEKVEVKGGKRKPVKKDWMQILKDRMANEAKPFA